MRRYLAVSMVCVVTAGALVGAGVAAASSHGAARAQLRSFICQKARDPGQREVSVTAVMRPVKGTEKLEAPLRVAEQGVRGRSLRTLVVVLGGNLGTWLSPTNPPSLGTRPGDVWNVNHPVFGDGAASAYADSRVAPSAGSPRTIACSHRRFATVKPCAYSGRAAAEDSPSCRSSRSRSPDHLAATFTSLRIADNRGQRRQTARGRVHRAGSLIRNKTVKHIKPLAAADASTSPARSTTPCLRADRSRSDRPTQQVDDYSRLEQLVGRHLHG